MVTRPARHFIAALLVTALALGAAAPVAAAEAHITVPPQLQPEVDFWIKVYTEISTAEGFLHDADDLGIVYRTLRFTRDVSSRERRDAIDR